MNTEWRTLTAAFDEEHRALMAVLGSLDDDDFARETNCPPWNLRELLVHIGFSACNFPQQPPAPAAGADLIEAADYYRRAERATPAYRTNNVDQAQRAALRYPAGGDAVALIEATWRRTKGRLEQLDPNHLMAGPGSVERNGKVLGATMVSVENFFLTRVIALAAHAVDVAITLRRPSWTTTAAAEVVKPVLLALLADHDPDLDLAWEAADFLILATGRRHLTPKERHRLGPRADSFPLLS